MAGETRHRVYSYLFSMTAPDLLPTLRSDVRRVAADLQRRGLRREVGSTLADLEKFYLTDDNRQLLTTMSRPRRFFRRIGWLLKGLFLRLTPARRVLLAVALFMLIFGVQNYDFRIYAGQVNIRFAGIGSLLLIILVMLELKDKLVARDELEAGWKVQMALMPQESPAIPGWDVWLYTRPANDVGGDMIDHMRLTDREHAIALGDVAGKALPAALLAVKLQATLRALAPRFHDLGAFGAAVNEILERDGLPSRFASLVYLIVGRDSGAVRLLNAGHMPPFVVRGSRVEALDRGSCVLGIMPETTFFEQRTELHDGDVLVAYSDGISEAMNEPGDFFGEERLQAALAGSTGLIARDIGVRVLNAVNGFMGEARPNDDLSLIVLRRRAAVA
jgi:serine phosphatase RsbU (regulator of sigma subunit)